MLEKPDKVFPCVCMAEGLVVSHFTDSQDYSDGEVVVKEDKEFRDCKDAPYIMISFWEMGHPVGKKWDWRNRLRAIWDIIRIGHPWYDMVIMKVATAKNLANHILYIIRKAEDEIKSGVNWLENEDIKETDSGSKAQGKFF